MNIGGDLPGSANTQADEASTRVGGRDFSRWAFYAVWDGDAALDGFLATSKVLAEQAVEPVMPPMKRP